MPRTFTVDAGLFRNKVQNLVCAMSFSGRVDQDLGKTNVNHGPGALPRILPPFRREPKKIVCDVYHKLLTPL